MIVPLCVTLQLIGVGNLILIKVILQFLGLIQLIARDCTKPAKKDGDKKGKVNVIFRDDYDDDYDDGFILTCFESRLSEYFEDCRDSDTSDSEIKIDNASLPDIESVSSDNDAPEIFPNFSEITISDIIAGFSYNC